MAEKKTALEKEWESFLRREKKLLRKYGRRKEPLLERKLQKAVPDSLSEKLEAVSGKEGTIQLPREVLDINIGNYASGGR